MGTGTGTGTATGRLDATRGSPGQARQEVMLAQAEARLREVDEIITTAAEARRVLREAEESAAALRAEAEAGAAATLAAARAQGLEEGRRAGREEGARLAREEAAHALETAFGIAAQARVDRAQLIADAEPEIIRLAVEVARKVIAREVEADADILRGLVTRALLKTAGSDRVRLHLNPVAIERLGDYLPALVARFAERGVDVVPDRAVEVAGALVETRSGTVDATAETQLAKIGRAMLALTGE
jgi:flagellar biosynthesis/type III secretory pathway protein FliH